MLILMYYVFLHIIMLRNKQVPSLLYGHQHDLCLNKIGKYREFLTHIQWNSRSNVGHVLISVHSHFWHFPNLWYFCSSISAILSTIIGVHFGHVLVHMKVYFTFHEQIDKWNYCTRLQFSYLTCFNTLLFLPESS